MAMWGDDKPILTSDNEKTKKGKAASDKDTFNMIGTVCDQCSGVDGNHKKSCANSN